MIRVYNVSATCTPEVKRVACTLVCVLHNAGEDLYMYTVYNVNYMYKMYMYM